MKVEFPFLDQFKQPMLNGRKTWTSRTRRYGVKGDTFERFGAEFQVTAVFQLTLGQVACHAYEKEGFKSPDEFRDCWIGLHPVKGFVVGQLVWVHVFKRQKEAEK